MNHVARAKHSSPLVKQRNAPRPFAPHNLGQTTGRRTTEIDFVKMNPASNITVLVTSEHPRREYRRIAKQLLHAENLDAEQIGFILPAQTLDAPVRLQMAGDEYCANAAMACAALHVSTYHSGQQGPLELLVEVSGSAKPLHCQVETEAEGYRCQLTSPIPLSVEPFIVPSAEVDTAALVRYSDAVHLVIEATGPNHLLRQSAENLIAQLARDEQVAVIAVLIYDPVHAYMSALVMVPAVNSLLWEASCGSGTASLGAYLATKTQEPVSLQIQQPGGTLTVDADYTGGQITGLHLGGYVEIIGSGKAYIHD